MTTSDLPDNELWAAIGDPSRRQVLDELLAAGEATASTLAQGLPLTRQAIAKHLNVLERVGLVGARRVGREVRYSVRADRLNEATRTMARMAARWDERLNDIKSIAEAARNEPEARRLPPAGSR